MILVVVISLFCSFYIAVPALIAVSSFALISKDRREKLIGQPNIRYLMAVIGISLFSSLIFTNWTGFFITIFLFLIMIFMFYVQSNITYDFYTSILNILITLSIAVSVFGSFQKLYFSHVLEVPPFEGRIYSVFANPNYYAHIIDMVIIIIIYKLMESGVKLSFKRKFFYLSVLALNFVTLILTNCRSSIIALILGVIIITVFHKKYWAAISLFVLYAIYLLLIQLKPDIFPRMDLLYLDTAFFERLKIWQASLDGIKRSPIIGQGVLSYRKLIFHRLPDVPYAIHSHNILLESVLSFGILGTSFISMYIVKSIRHLKKVIGYPKGKSLFVFILAIISTNLIHGITDVTILGPQTGLLFAIILSGFCIKFNETDK